MLNIIEERKEIQINTGCDGFTYISQMDHKDEEMTIAIHPEDITILIEHLKQSQAEGFEIRKKTGK